MKHQVNLEVENRSLLKLTYDHTEAEVTGYGPSMSTSHEVMAISDHSIVIKVKGYSMNPGSKYSGLSNYIPTEIVVFVISEKRSDREFIVHAVNSFNTRKGK